MTPLERFLAAYDFPQFSASEADWQRNYEAFKSALRLFWKSQGKQTDW